MKITMKKSLAVILSLVMCVSVLFGMNLSVFAADTNTVTYVKSGNYVYNWGERGEDATFLSPMAIEFYTKNGVTLNSLLAFEGDSSTSQTPYSDSFDELSSLMEENHNFKTSYDGTKSLYRYTDCENSSTSNMSAFYSGKQLTPNWDSAATWNREHTWPNSKSNSGKSYTNRETDIIMLRPATPSNNSSRGNTAYGESSGYFNPNKFVGTTGYDVRGDAARAILYVYVRWGGSDSHDGALNYMWGSSGVIESKDILLKWMQEDPVDTWEMGRNDATESITGTRNIFIDYPELAFDLFDASIPSHTTPSGYAASNGTVGGDIVGDGNNSGNVGDDTTGDSNNDAPVVEGDKVTFEFGSNGSASHSDGSEATAYSETVDGYTLELKNLSKVYKNARDAKGNSALKLGTSSATGSFSLTAPDNVIKVIFNVAGYKAKTVTVNVNGTAQSITTTSDNGAYTDIEFDTTTTKNVTFATSTGYRCMINSITFVLAGNDNADEGDKIYVDENDVVISGSANAFPEGAVVSAEKIAMGENSIIDTALSTIAEKFVAFDLTAKVDNALTQLNQGKTVTLTLPIPEGYDTEKVAIVYIPESAEDESEVEILESVVDAQANTISAELTHFSYYAVIEQATPASDEGNDSTEGGTPTEPKTITFNLGANGSASHADGNSKTSYTETVDGYTLSITSGTNFYTGARDAKGNSALKMGTSSKTGSFSLTAPDDVTKVIFYVAGYKAKTVTVKINGTSHSISTLSNNGAYTAIEVDTTTTKAITFATGTNYRCMINTIEFVVPGSSGGNTPETPSYTITAESNNTNYGTVELSGNVITAKAKAGYTLAEGDAAYTVTDGTATVVRNDSTFTVTATSDATITINFVALPVYTVQFSENGTFAEPITKYVGGQITLPDHTSAIPDGYEFEGWATQENESDYSKILAAGSKYTVDGNITLYAQYSEVSSTPTSTVTIDFTTTADRVSQTTSQQVWSANGITVTNSKTSSSSNVVADYNPVKFYAKSSLVIACSNMTEIVITTTSGTYANVWSTTIGTSNPDVKRVSVSGSVVTIEFNNPVDSLEIASFSGQTRVSKMEITKENASSVTEYSVAYVENGTQTGTATVNAGANVTLPNHDATKVPEGKKFIGWATTQNATEGIYNEGDSFIVNDNVIFYAQYEALPEDPNSLNFVKVTENLDDWSGTYLIVFEEGGKAYNGSLTSLKTANGIDVAINNSKIKVTDSTLAASFTIEASEGGYTIKSASGYYIGRTSANADSNDLLFSQSTQYINSISMGSDGVNIVSGNTYLRWNASSAFFRYYRSSTYTSQKPIALYKLDVADISGAQVTVGADISMNYYVDITNIAGIDDGELAMRFTLANGGAPTTIALDKSKTIVKDSKTYYVFTFAGVAPQQMCDNIRAELLLNGTVVDSLGEYSVQQNVANLLGDAPSTELKQFATDLLYYGAAAQTYTKYNTDNLATSGDIAALLGTPSNVEPTSDDAMSLTRNPDAPQNAAYFRAASVWFDSTNKIIIKLAGVTSDTKLYLDDNLVEINYDSATDTYSFTTIALEATRFDEIFIFDIYEGDEFVQSLEYSINAYAYSKYQNSNNPNMAQLALALYRVGRSAEAFAASL